MRRGNIIVLLAALVMGVVAAFMARSWLQRQTVVQPEQDTNGTIVVAAAPLGYGTILSKDNVMKIPWHGPKINAAFTSKEELFKEGRRVVLTPLERNEPIFRPKVTGPGSRASLSSLLEDGMRAVTVRVDDVRGVAGFVLPADRVDVVLIRNESQPQRRHGEFFRRSAAVREGLGRGSACQRAAGAANGRESGHAGSDDGAGALVSRRHSSASAWRL